MSWRTLLISSALIFSTTLPAKAQTSGGDPYVFVSDRNADGTPAAANSAWYLLQMTIRPTGTVVAGVPVSAINSFRQREMAERPAISVTPWCFANALSEHSFVSSNRAIQGDIEQTFARNPDHHFQLRGRFTNGNELLAVVGHFEECDGDREKGSFIMLLDPSISPARIVYVDTLPYVSGLQYLRLVDGNITVSTCFECGDVTGLFYDQRRSRFYWESLGD